MHSDPNNWQCSFLLFEKRKHLTQDSLHCYPTPNYFHGGEEALEQNLQLLITDGVCCIYSQQSEDVMKLLPLKNIKILTSQNRATKRE